MKVIVLLCGSNEAGKTKTLKTFFGLSITGRLRPMQLLKRIINKKTVYAISLSSPQEQSDFCQVEEVKQRIQKRISVCDQDSQGEDYALIIPFGIYQEPKKKGEINSKCIIEPMLSLKSKGIRIVPIYLRKERSIIVHLIDILMRKIAKYQIESDKNYERQAKELERILRSELSKQGKE